jgi:hypothetical protein
MIPVKRGEELLANLQANRFYQSDAEEVRCISSEATRLGDVAARARAAKR